LLNGRADKKKKKEQKDKQSETKNLLWKLYNLI